MTEPVKIYAQWLYDDDGRLSPHMAELHTLPAPKERTGYVLAADHDRVVQEMENKINYWRDLAKAKVSEVERLLAALAPFARVATVFDDDRRGATMVRTGVFTSWPRLDGDYELTVEHLRDARAALAGGEEG